MLISAPLQGVAGALQLPHTQELDHRGFDVHVLQKGAPIWRVQDLLGKRDEARQGAPRGMGEIGGGSSGAVIQFGIALPFLCEALISILQFVSFDEPVRRRAR